MRGSSRRKRGRREVMRTKKPTKMNMQMTRKECRSIRFAIGPYQEGRDN